MPAKRKPTATAARDTGEWELAYRHPDDAIAMTYIRSWKFIDGGVLEIHNARVPAAPDLDDGEEIPAETWYVGPTGLVTLRKRRGGS